MFLSSAWKNDLYNNPEQAEFNYTLSLKGFTYKISFPLLYFSHNTHLFKNEVKEGPEILLPNSGLALYLMSISITFGAWSQFYHSTSNNNL